MSGYLSPELGANWLRILHPDFTEPVKLSYRISEELESSEKMKDINISQSLVATLTKKPNFSFQKLQP
jgi:hypothetical protein